MREYLCRRANYSKGILYELGKIYVFPDEASVPKSKREDLVLFEPLEEEQPKRGKGSSKPKE